MSATPEQAWRLIYDAARTWPPWQPLVLCWALTTVAYLQWRGRHGWMARWRAWSWATPGVRTLHAALCLGLALPMSAAATWAVLARYHGAVTDLHDGRFRDVVGIVTPESQAPHGSGKDEAFTVLDVHFPAATEGPNFRADGSGVLRPGQEVRIRFAGPKVEARLLTVEVRP